MRMHSVWRFGSSLLNKHSSTAVAFSERARNSPPFHPMWRRVDMVVLARFSCDHEMLEMFLFDYRLGDAEPLVYLISILTRHIQPPGTTKQKNVGQKNKRRLLFFCPTFFCSECEIIPAL